MPRQRVPVSTFGPSLTKKEASFQPSVEPLGREQDPKGVMLEALIQDFGSLKDFRDQMSEAAVGLYASGYAWLIMDWEGRLQIKTTANEEVPILRQEIPILNVDVWEHAYYLQYRDRRKDYVSAWHRLINWRKVARRYEEALQYVREERMLHGEGWIEPGNPTIEEREGEFAFAGIGTGEW